MFKKFNTDKDIKHLIPGYCYLFLLEREKQESFWCGFFNAKEADCDKECLYPTDILNTIEKFSIGTSQKG